MVLRCERINVPVSKEHDKILQREDGNYMEFLLLGAMEKWYEGKIKFARATSYLEDSNGLESKRLLNWYLNSIKK